MTRLGVTHSNTHRIKHLHINSCPCWPCQGASRQMPPSSAMEAAAFSPALLHLNKRFLKFCFQLIERMPESPCSHKVHNEKRKHCFLSSKQPGTITFILPHLQELLPCSGTPEPPPAPPNWFWITPCIAGLPFPSVSLHLGPFQSFPCSNLKLEFSLPASVYEEQCLKRVLWYSVKGTT